jgi:hypothetical protein
MSSVRLSHKARLTLKVGKIGSIEEIIDKLVDQFEKEHKE